MVTSPLMTKELSFPYETNETNKRLSHIDTLVYFSTICCGSYYFFKEYKDFF
jgi:hypothetical protein